MSKNPDKYRTFEFQIPISKIKQYRKLELIIDDCLRNKKDLKYEHLSELENLKTESREERSVELAEKIKFTIEYFKKQKGFYFEPNEFVSIEDDEVENELKKEGMKSEFDFDYSLNFETNIKVLFFTASNFRVNKENKKEFLTRLISVIGHLSFPKRYSLSKKRIIAGFIAVQFGVLKKEGDEPESYATYHKYLEDAMRYNKISPQL